MKQAPKRQGKKLLGAFMRPAIRDAIEEWVAGHEERTSSLFLREAVREKLAREGIRIRKPKTV